MIIPLPKATSNWSGAFESGPPIYCARNGQPGSALDDWLQAEREVLGTARGAFKIVEPSSARWSVRDYFRSLAARDVRGRAPRIEPCKTAAAARPSTAVRKFSLRVRQGNPTNGFSLGMPRVSKRSLLLIVIAPLYAHNCRPDRPIRSPFRSDSRITCTGLIAGSEWLG